MQHFIKPLALGSIALFLLSSCCKPKTSSKPLEETRDEIMKSDRAFSDYCLKHGVKKAFYHYADENAVLLRDNSLPIVGREKIKTVFADKNDSLSTLTWKPIDAYASKSGELGYSYGLYKVQTKDTVFEGSYISVWKRDRDGNWKYVLDSGNQGLGGK